MAAYLSSASTLYAAQITGGFNVVSFWPAALGLAFALSIGVACVWAIKKSRRASDHDDVSVWRALAENIAEIVILLSRDGKILYANRWQNELNTIVGTPVEELIDEIERTRWREFLPEHSRGRDSCTTAVFKMKLPGNGVGFWELRLAPLENSPNGAQYILCARDVSDIHLKEVSKDVLYKITLASSRIEALPELITYVEQQVSRLVDTRNFFLAVYHKDTNTYTKIVSRDKSGFIESMESTLDLSGGLTDYVRTYGKPVLMNETNREQLKMEFQLRPIGDSAACWLGVPLRVGNDVQGVFVVQSYEDPNRYTQADADLLTIVAGSIGRALERQQAQADLKHRESKLRLLTERMPALLWSQDVEGKITYATGAALGSIGLTERQFMGRAIYDVVSCAESDIADRMIFADGAASIDFHFKHRNRSFEAFVEPTFSDRGQFVGATGVALDVTERDRAGKELRRYFDISGDSITVANLSGVLLQCNEAYLRMTGYTREERLSQPGHSLIHPDDMAAVAEAMGKLLRGESVIALEVRVRCKDGSYKWVAWNSVLGADDGLIYSSGKDITHRREIENALRVREEQLQLFIRHSPAALAMFDNDMRYIVISERWRLDYGIGDKEVIGKNHYEVFPEIGEEWKEIHKRCLGGATEECTKDPFPRADGSIDWVRWEIKPWYSGDGEIGGIIMFTEVITSEVEAEQELARSRNLARQIVASSLDAVVAMDNFGLVTEWNPQAEKIFGYSRDEAIGKLLHNLIIPDAHAKAHFQGLENFARTGVSDILNRQVQMSACRKDGTEFPIEMSIGTIPSGDEVLFSAFIRDISDRLQHERDLHESRHQLKEAQRIAGLGFWNWNAITDEMYVSKEKLVLYDRPNLKLPMTFFEFLEIVHPEDRQIFIDAHQAIMGGQNSFELHYRIVRPSGEIRHAFSQGEALRDQNGNILKLFGTTLDHTDRVLAEERVRSSEERLGLALEGSSDGFWDWNVVSGDCYFNPRIVEWLGFDPNEFEHHVKFWENLIHPDYLDQFNSAFADHVENRTTHYEIEERIRTKSGSWIWVLSRGKVVQWNEDGTPLRAAGTWTNITIRKNMEARATQLGRIMDHSMNEVYIVEKNSMKIIEANHRARLNTGYSLEELQEMVISNLLENWSESELKNLAAPLINGSMEAVRSSSIHVRKDGTKYPFDATLQVMDWNDKTVFVSIGIDNSEKVKAEREFKDLEAQLRHAQRLETIGTLAGGIAHDFNNILTPILGYADMVACELEPESNTRRDIEQVIQAAYRAKGLVQQILAFSRQADQTRHPLQIDIVVKETIRLLRASVPPNIEFCQNVHNVGCVLSDPTMLNQILMNLCTNAYQAIGDEIGEISVSLNSEYLYATDKIGKANLSEGNYAILTVEDSGPGIDSQTIERIFEPFFTTKDVGKGTGLGLSVVHGIVQAHGGAITVDSELGKGTKITVFFPLLEVSEAVAMPVEHEDLQGTEHILLCDDDDTILLLARQMLENFGYKVSSTNDPVAALVMLAQANPPISLVVVDDRMPILSGHDVALSARDYNPNLPVILLSASLQAEDNQEPFAAVLAKPVGSNELAKIVRTTINNSQIVVPQ
ncbi:MAG: PAS domain S-box protein [bacterium]|nr:PAS domain S-box protein [bacterium]